MSGTGELSQSDLNDSNLETQTLHLYAVASTDPKQLLHTVCFIYVHEAATCKQMSLTVHHLDLSSFIEVAAMATRFVVSSSCRWGRTGESGVVSVG